MKEIYQTLGNILKPQTMLTNKHTPGPWQISWGTFNSGEEHGIYANGEMDLKGYQIATVNGYPTMSKEGTEEQGKANSKLIAAAPELLSICKKIFQSESLPKHLSEELEAAINKATI